MIRTLVATALAAALLGGCGGGSSSLPRHGMPATARRQIDVTITIIVPRSTADGKRRPTYVSPATMSAIVDVTPDNGPATHTVIPCSTSVCTGTVPATIGVDTFSIALNDVLDGSGKMLARGTTTATVAEGAANSVNVTFNGIIASMFLNLIRTSGPFGSSGTFTVNVNGRDADGNTIVGPGDYDNPIVITDSDTSGSTTLSKTTKTGPNDPSPQLVYSGGQIVSDSLTALITATVPGDPAVKAATTELVPVLQAGRYPASSPAGVTFGPDGALWYTEQSGGNIGRLTSNGSKTLFQVPVPPPNFTSRPTAITSGGDGTLWFTDIAPQNESIQSVTTSGSFTRFSVSRSSARTLAGIVWGPDNNLWVTDGDQIVRFTPSGVETDFPTPTSSAGARAIIVGPDGALWFTEVTARKIGRITTSGAITEFAVNLGTASGTPFDITSGPDGALWFSDTGTGVVGRMQTNGTVQEFPGAATNGAIVAGTDGAIYFSKLPPPQFTEGTQPCGQLGRISVRGTISCFPVTGVQNFAKLAAGSGGVIGFMNREGDFTSSGFVYGGYVGTTNPSAPSSVNQAR